MIQTSSRVPVAVGRAVGVLLAAEATTFLLGAITHLGVGIPWASACSKSPGSLTRRSSKD
jgi:hypothetical protein